MGITLREWSQQWLEVYVKPVAKPSGYEHYYDNLQKHILPKLGDMPLKSLTAAVVQHFLNEESLHGNLRTGGALSAKSIKNMRVVLDVCCKRAVADGMMPANPVAATVYTHCRSKKHNIMSDSDQKVLEKWLFSDLSLNNAGIILALYSGMRLGEVCAARWGNYDAMSGTLHITQTVRRVMVDSEAEYGKRTELIFSSAKSDASERDLYLPEVLQGLLTVQYQRFESLFKRTPNADDFIIYNTVGGVMDPDHLSSYWGDVLDGLGLPHVRFHDIRHPYVKHTTKIFSLRLMDFQAQAYPDARRKTRGACQLRRGGQSQSPVRPLCNRERFSCLPPQSKISWILYATSIRLSGYTSTRSISSSASSVVSVSASKITLDASLRLSCRACSSCFCFACANTAA